jgi:hypothetical protein
MARSRNIAEILGVRTDLLEQPPGGFDGREIRFALLRRRLAISPCWRQMRWIATWLTGRSNSRFRRAAPKVGSLRRRASNCCSISGAVLWGY